MSRPARLLTCDEVSAIKAVRDGAGVVGAAQAFGLTKKVLCYVIGERIGGVAALRRARPADELLDRLTQTAEIGLPETAGEGAAEAAEEPCQTSPFTFPLAVHREDPAVRARDYRRGVSGYRDLTGALLGDPPVGRSALDRLRKGRAA